MIRPDPPAHPALLCRATGAESGHVTDTDASDELESALLEVCPTVRLRLAWHLPGLVPPFEHHERQLV
jgi:hypothetical protein